MADDDQIIPKDPHIKLPRVRHEMYKGEAAVLESKVGTKKNGEKHNFGWGDRKKPNKELTQMQENFCQIYAVTGSEITAYRRAGYKSISTEKDWEAARRFLQYKFIQRRIKEIKEQHMAEYKKEFVHTVEAVVNGLWEVYAKAIEAEDFSGANRALELLGKNLNMFVEQKNINVKSFTASEDPDIMKADILRLAKAAGVELNKEIH